MARDNKTETLERGNIYFFYRPKVGQEHPEHESDIQRMYMVLSPEDKTRYRLAVVGHKELPLPESSDKNLYWGFVDEVHKDPSKIKDGLGEKHYSTKTRGERTIGTARPAGEGVYRIINHNGHTHLAYALELPKKEGKVQEELNILDEASYIISVKNPEKPSPKYMRGTPDADYPKTLMERFRGRRFSEVDPPSFLDHKGAQFLLVTATEDVKVELGIELQADDENESKADIFNDLRLDKSKRPVEPLLKGEWE